MFGAIGNISRLAKAARTFARYDFFLTPEQKRDVPWFARFGMAVLKTGAARPETEPGNRVAAALASLGPSYIKLGQFLATRPDLIGAKRAFELKSLQDKLPPFGMDEARRAVEQELGAPVEQLFAEFGPPIAAASVAQVHRATTTDGREVAVKILRPGVEKRFSADLSSFYFAARMIERVSAEGRRLRPVAAVEMLDRSMKLEMDLRMEASAISEMAGNIKEDQDFRVPVVNWQRTAKRVLTTDWIDGTPISDIAALKAQGFDLVKLGNTVIQSFLRHAIRDGFFHADMHQGNLFVDPAGKIVAVDFGITGRLSPREGLVLAEILYGFITRDYMRVSQVHFDVGYVPPTESVEDFAQALRSIGEPIMGLPADQISMARLLTQLFEVTGQFNMATQPQLLLLQKTMVVVEGVARTLNPNLNMWQTAEPVVSAFIQRKLGPIGRIEDALDTARSVARLSTMLPDVINEVVTHQGVRLDEETTQRLAAAQARSMRWQRYAMMTGAACLLVIAVKMIM
jgi:ubiquinone biosynthesis protein